MVTSTEVNDLNNQINLLVFSTEQMTCKEDKERVFNEIELLEKQLKNQ